MQSRKDEREFSPCANCKYKDGCPLLQAPLQDRKSLCVFLYTSTLPDISDLKTLTEYWRVIAQQNLADAKKSLLEANQILAQNNEKLKELLRDRIDSENEKLKELFPSSTTPKKKVRQVKSYDELIKVAFDPLTNDQTARRAQKALIKMRDQKHIWGCKTG